jgi:plastin-1
MRKAKMSFQSGQVKQVIRTYAVEIQTGDKKDLDEEAVTLKLRKAMGANCEYTFCYLC